MARKCDWHYAPKKVMVHQAGVRPVVSARIFPPGKHPPATPIVSSMTAVQLVTDTGHSRWFGFDDARINSDLRVVACGGFINPRNEIAKDWKRCGKLCDNLQGTLSGARRKRKR